MRGGNGVVRVIGPLGTPDDVSPPGPNAVAGLDIDDPVRVGTTDTTGKLRVVDVLDGVRLGGSAQTDQLALIGAVDREFLSPLS